jgi:hypothetical protein
MVVEQFLQGAGELLERRVHVGGDPVLVAARLDSGGQGLAQGPRWVYGVANVAFFTLGVLALAAYGAAGST